MRLLYRAIPSLYLLFALTGCAQKPGDYLDVASDIQPYYAAFKTEAASRGANVDISHLRIQFDEGLIGSNKAGSCTISVSKSIDLVNQISTTHLNITINPEKFYTADEYLRYELIFHELGHCLLGLRHNDNTILVLTDKGIIELPASWMSTFQSGSRLSSNEKETLIAYYITQLFNPSASNEDLTIAQNIHKFSSAISLYDEKPKTYPDFINDNP